MVHFAGQSERRAVPAKVQQLLPAYGNMTMRQRRLLHAVHHTGQLPLHRGSGDQGGQARGQRRGESQGGRSQAHASPHHSRLTVMAGTRAAVCLLLQEACHSRRGAPALRDGSAGCC